MPPGTRSLRLSVATPQVRPARDVLIEAGYRVRAEPNLADEFPVEAYRLADPTDPDAFSEPAFRAFRDAGIQARSTGSAVSFAGGTPAHRWIPVYVGATDTPFGVLAPDRAELDRQVAQLASIWVSSQYAQT